MLKVNKEDTMTHVIDPCWRLAGVREAIKTVKQFYSLLKQSKNQKTKR